MKTIFRILAVTIGLFGATVGLAQTSAVSSDAPPIITAPYVSNTPPTSGATTAIPVMQPAMATAIVTGSSSGKVWVNTKSKAYHCEGTRFYGKTKAGAYMPESEAKAQGNHGPACAK